MFNYSDYTH